MVKLESPNGDSASNDLRRLAAFSNEPEVDDELRRVTSNHESEDGELELVVRNSNFFFRRRQTRMQ